MGGSIGNDHILSRTVLVVFLFLLRLSVVVPSSSLMLKYLAKKIVFIFFQGILPQLLENLPVKVVRG